MSPILASLLAFIPAISLLTITPGLDTALILRTAVSEGPRRAGMVWLGIAAGCLVWAVLVAVGLGALLAVSQLAYTVLRWAGAGYLMWLGYKMLRHPRQAFLITDGTPQQKTTFTKGLLTNLLNPKVGIFYVSFLPQFVPHGVLVGPYIVLLGAIHDVIGLMWFACLVAATRPISKLLRTPKVIQALDQITGSVFVLFGIGLALESRRA